RIVRPRRLRPECRRLDTPRGDVRHPQLVIAVRPVDAVCHPLAVRRKSARRRAAAATTSARIYERFPLAIFGRCGRELRLRGKVKCKRERSAEERGTGLTHGDKRTIAGTYAGDTYAGLPANPALPDQRPYRCRRHHRARRT